MKNYCECENKGRLLDGMSSLYNPETELPFVNHEPGQCKCTNDLQEYLRAGKVVALCSCCFTTTDIRISK